MTCQFLILDETLAVEGELSRVASASVSRSATDDVPLLESASIEYDAHDAGWDGGWLRIVADGNALGTFRFSPTTRKVTGDRVTVTAEGYSVLKPAEENDAGVGAALVAGSDVAAFARKMLSPCPGTIDCEGTTACPSTVVFDDGASRLSALWAVLDACGWGMRLDGYGCVHVGPLPTEPALRLDSTTSHVVRDGYEAGESLSYTREADGDAVRPMDAVAVELPRAAMSGTYRVLSQELTIGAGVTVAETVGELERGDKDGD